MPSLGNIRLGPQGVRCFRCAFLLDMPSSTIPESSSVILTQVPHRQHWPSPKRERLGALNAPTIRFGRGQDFGASWFAIATAYRVASLLGGSDRVSPAPETFTSGLPACRSPFTLPDMTTVASGPSPPAGLAPAGTAVSIAAPLQPCLFSPAVPVRHQ